MTKDNRLHEGVGSDIDTGRVEAFIRDLYEVCDRHGMMIEAGDVHAGTLIHHYEAGNVIDAFKYADASHVLGEMPKSAFGLAAERDRPLSLMKRPDGWVRPRRG